MGGHGGLNILPQKRWNVYGRENRLKVAEDEAKFAAEQGELEAKHKSAEATYRRQKLLAEARKRQGMPLHLEADVAALAALAQSPQSGSLREREPDMEGPVPGRSLESGQETPPEPLRGEILDAGEDIQNQVKKPERFSLFDLEEAQAKNPEAEEERRRQVAARGNIKTQTSDAKFDERFQFGHGLIGGKSTVPWYAQRFPGVMKATDAADLRSWESSGTRALQASHAAAEGGDASKEERDQSLSSSDEDSYRKKKTKSSSDRHKTRKSKKTKKEKSRHKDAQVAAAKADLFAALRAERLEREEQEAKRERELLRSMHTGRQDRRGYNNTYGYGRRR